MRSSNLPTSPPDRLHRRRSASCGSVRTTCALKTRTRADFAATAIARPERFDRLRPGRLSVPAARCGRQGKTWRSIFAVMLALLLLLPALLGAATIPGTEILNTARADFNLGNGTELTRLSNTVRIVSVTVSTPAAIELLRYAPALPQAETLPVPITAYSSGDAAGPFQLLSPPPPTSGLPPLDLSQPVPLAQQSLFHAGDALFIRLKDLDQNLLAGERETVVIEVRCAATGDREILRLTETEFSSGVFLGYLPLSGNSSKSPGDGILAIGEGSEIVASYADPDDGSDNATTAGLVDPTGLVFDSRTGLPVDGAEVTLLDGAGNPLPYGTIRGDDGVSVYPATVVSGGEATDTGGQLYRFTPGRFRFPLVPPGSYRLRVVFPDGAGYVFPSTAATIDLQTLPGAPFALDEQGSRGLAFAVNPGPVVRIDLPVDPARGSLWLRKEAGKESAAIGDFVPWLLTVESPGTSPSAGLIVTDRLPPGFRYLSGSARLNGAPLSDPVIAGDGRTLTFHLGPLPGGGSGKLLYVTEVTAGARPGRAVNHAVAAAGDRTSNSAEAEVRIEEPFFRDSVFLLGRVAAGGCDEMSPASVGVPGVRIYLEDGTYVVSDAKGLFHFEGVRPGVHVVQLDDSTIPEIYEPVLCDANDRFAGRADSQFVDLQGGSLWRTDFHLALKPPPTGEVTIALRSLNDGDAVALQVRLASSTVAVDNRRLSVILPAGLHYLPGSAALAGRPLADPEVSGPVLTFRLAEAGSDWQEDLTFRASPERDLAPDELRIKAVLSFDTPARENQRTPVVETILALQPGVPAREEAEILRVQTHFDSFSTELGAADRAQLDRLIGLIGGRTVLQQTAVGHTDSQPIARRSRTIFADNQQLSEARARQVAEYLRDRLSPPPEKTTIVGRSSSEPVADNATDAGRALNRRVEVTIEAEGESRPAPPVLLPVQPESKTERVATTGKVAAAAPAALPDPIEAEAVMPDFDEAWLAGAEPGVEWLWPSPQYHPPIASLKAAIKHRPGEKVVLLRNGEPVSPLCFDGVKKNAAGTVAVTRWRGIDVSEGDNLFEARIKNADGEVIERRQRTIHYSGPPEKAVLVPEKSRLLVDGKTPPVLAVRLLDRDGHPARQGVVGEFSIQAPHRPWQEVEPLQIDSASSPSPTTPRYEVRGDGIAYLKLDPDAPSGEAVVGFKFAKTDQELRAWLRPAPRDWILVGLAEGTAGYNAVSGHVENLPSGVDDDLYEDGRLAFFAKGQIKGEWLLTMAYDSDKPKVDGESLFQTIDPDTYFTLYGDASQQRHEAPSARKLFVKVERDQFYALFGDFDTGLTVTELSRYSRSLNGFKTELHSEHFGLNAFASESRQGFVKDELRGDGTSGLYRLSAGDLVTNSEKVVIEVRDRLRSEKILSSRSLARHVDYNIDYNDGTIYFKEPIPSTDRDFNPVFIVVDYETRDGEGTAWSYGGRGALYLPAQNLELGASYIHEEGGGDEGELVGADAAWNLWPGGTLRLEAATSEREEDGESFSGDAWRAELEHRSSALLGSLYYRELDPGFGLGQQRASEAGTRKIGAEVLHRLDKDHSLEGELYRQYNLDNDAVRDVAEIKLTRQTERYSLSTGLRHAEDRFDDGAREESTQALFASSWQATRRLGLHLTHEQALGGRDESSDFPTRTLFGLDYRLSDRVDLFAEQEFTWGQDGRSEGTRLGLRSQPWNGGQLNSSLEQRLNEFGPSLFALLGLKQIWDVTRDWTIDAGLDRSHTLRKSDARDFDPEVPSPTGSDEDFTAVSLGASRRVERWIWENRVEYRTSDSSDRWSLFTAVAGELRPGLGVTGRLQFFDEDRNHGDLNREGEIRLGLAYRPERTRWIVLDRLEYAFDKERSEGEIDLDNWRVVNNLIANYRPNGRSQISLQYGAKYVQEKIEGACYSGYTDLVAAEGRRDLNENWDVGVRGSVLHSWQSDAVDFGAGVSLGYLAMRNAWVSAGYNFIGFEDEDFSRDDFTAQGPFVKFRVKFDQHSVKDAIKWLQHI